MKISENITLEQAIYSKTAIRLGITNMPSHEATEAMELVANKIFEPCLKACPGLYISSFYRSPKLNSAIGGSKSSQHCKGEAIDMCHANKLLLKDLFYWIKNNLEFDQLIWEFGTSRNPDWVHCSFSKTKNRKEILRAVSQGGKTKYIKFDL